MLSAALPRNDGSLKEVEEAPCFLAGANFIFVGDRLPTTNHPIRDADDALLADLKMRPMRAAAAP